MGRDTFSYGGFVHEVPDVVWKDVSYGKDMKAVHKPLKMRVLFIFQTLSKARRFLPSSRNTRRSLLVRT